MAIDSRSIITYMTVDLTAQNNFDYVRAVQGDNSSRYVFVEVLKNQQPYIKDESDTQNISAVLMGTKPDGKTIFNECEFKFENDAYYVCVELTTAITSTAGKSGYSIAFFSTAKEDGASGGSYGKKLESFPFNIYVAESGFDPSEMVSSSEWTEITNVIANIGEIRQLRDDTRDYADEALVSETNAKTSEDNAKESEINAKTSEDNALSSANNALTSANNALSSEKKAAASEKHTTDMSNTSESWAIGGTDTRVGEDTNNSKYWSEQSSSYASSSEESSDLSNDWAIGKGEYYGYIRKTETDLTKQSSAYYANVSKGYMDTLIEMAQQGLLKSVGEYNPETIYHSFEIVSYDGCSFLVTGNNFKGHTPNKNVVADNYYQILAKGSEDASELTQETEPSSGEQTTGGFWLQPYL